jgi:hypothetical protein
MSEQLLKRFEELTTQGAQLAPLGGFDFSGYNARLQNKYLEWRKGCLELLEQVGPIGFPYKSKIAGDQNGGYFFQSAAMLILNAMKELQEKVKSSPDLLGAGQPLAPPIPGTVTVTDTPGARVLKPPPKKDGPPSAVPATKSAAEGGSPTKVFVVGDNSDPLRVQLTDFLGDIGLKAIAIDRQHGQMLSLEGLTDEGDAKYAFLTINSDDLAYVMFEIGHFVGRLGKGRVCVLHMTDVSFPKNVPGVTVKPIVVKLEEASFSIIKELKANGYKVNI